MFLFCSNWQEENHGRRAAATHLRRQTSFARGAGPRWRLPKQWSPRFSFDISAFGAQLLPRSPRMPKMKLEGSFVALITPFNADGAVDFGAFRTLIDFHARHGTAALLIMGSTGETSLLSPEEKKRIVVETAKMRTGRMPIFFGCTGNNTDSTIAGVRFARDNGADGAILAAPAYICASEADIEKFFLDVANASDLPLGLYNNPP